jgi:hypothetical protein
MSPDASPHISLASKLQLATVCRNLQPQIWNSSFATTQARCQILYGRNSNDTKSMPMSFFPFSANAGSGNKKVIAQDHLWIVAFVRTPVCAVKLILACTDGLTGKYPLFLFTPVPYAAMKDDAYIYPSLISAARHLQTHLPTHRIYSVFGRDILSRTFATIWTQQTNIPLISEPYYHCKITYLTRTALELNRRELPSIPMAQIRPAEPGDWEGVAKICHGFAATSVRQAFLYVSSYTQ